MAITAQSVIRRAVELLQDPTSVRWPVNELVRWLNDAQREVVVYRPDSMVTNATLTCISGSRQSIPANGSKLIEVVRNAASASNKRAVRMINREILDAQTPGWHALASSVNVVHYMFDARDPKVFYVYPPAASDAQLDIVYSAYPTDVVEPGEGSVFSNVVGNISLPDIYSNALLDYVLYRAYSKDASYAGNAQRAQAHYAAFANALGIEIKATVAVAPNPKDNPNHAAAQINNG